MADPSFLKEIQTHLDKRPLSNNLKTLFCETLHWGLPKALPFDLQVGSPISQTLKVTPIAELSGMPVFLIKWPKDELPRMTERRALHRSLSKNHLEHLICYVNKDDSQAAFVWAKKRTEKRVELRTLSYSIGSPARTTIERLAELFFSIEELGLFGEPQITKVIEKLNSAFDVEAVTDQFFKGYKYVFDRLQKMLSPKSNDPVWAHDYSLQFLNRMMFLYFIQKKRWLGEDPGFILTFWRAYKDSGQPKDSFFEKWLSVLFFEAFNERFQAGRSDRRYFPPEIKSALANAPFLNGGLFSPNEKDERLERIGAKIPDEFFESLFDRFDGTTPGFLERYNFTITESTPFDIEVAVDPEMIGKVYESLVNITFEGITEEDLRGKAGIFYTPRVEIDLMCRLSLVDWLTNNLGEELKPLIYNFVFAYEPQEKDEADSALRERNLWPTLNRLLQEVTICDPACGSGSFLIGMLLILDDLQSRAAKELGIEETPYERRRRIIGQNLYGVDVMDWAVHVAELRLWLQLVIETELKPAERKFRPLLPNLSFKIRQGDSLLQEVGGINFSLHRTHLDLPNYLKGKITQLKGKKLRFFQGDTHGLSETKLKKEELDLFREILQNKSHYLKEEIKKLSREIESQPEQLSLKGIGKRDAKQIDLLTETLKHERDEKARELSRIENAYSAIKTASDLPFVWDISFVEIFEGEKSGFDIVLGNPPYVRQEKIEDPQGVYPKKTYKEKLQVSVSMAYPRFFTGRRIDGKSDLYVYFYLHGLSLLNEKGSFCFITSNSWLDVGYGAELQEFLLKHSHVRMILDNEARRSFAQADVNTIIALLSPPDDRKESGLKKNARFVMFKVPFEDILSPVIFQEIEEATERLTRPEFRVCVLNQKILLEEGMEIPEDKEGRSLIGKAKYSGNKWGGKYLRAPEIFFTILEKGKGKLVRLGDIAEVRRGITTGANEFFYLDDEKIREWGIEKEFLKPVIKSPRECRSIIVKPEDLKYKIFMCHKDKSELKGTNALEYIKWGESQKFHERPTCRSRPRWWDVGRRRIGQLMCMMSMNDRHPFWINGKSLVDARLYDIYCSEKLIHPIAISLNSTITPIFIELIARANLGEGALDFKVYEAASLPILDFAKYSFYEKFPKSFFNRTIGSIFDEIHQPDRRALDEVVFDVLGLTAGEREAVYEAVVNLVRTRLFKAQSL